MNLPVNPYTVPSYGRDLTTGVWVDDFARRAYNEDILVLVNDARDIATDIDQLMHAGLNNVGHTATREACRGILDAARQLVNTARDLLQTEADC